MLAELNQSSVRKDKVGGHFFCQRVVVVVVLV